MEYIYNNRLSVSRNRRLEAKGDALEEMLFSYDQEYIDSDDGQHEFEELVSKYYQEFEWLDELGKRCDAERAAEKVEVDEASMIRAMAEANATAMGEMLDRRVLEAKESAERSVKADDARLLCEFHADQEKRSHWDYVDPNVRSRKHL